MRDERRPTSAVVRQLVSAAIRAPSSHNTQPWLFRPTSTGLDLLADRTRALPVNDPYDRELTISCGAALHNVEVAARQLQLRPSTVLLPDVANADLLATIALAPETNAPPVGAEICLDALDRRQTTRGSLEAPADRHELDDLLPLSVDGVTCTLIDTEDREVIAGLVAEGDRAQFADRQWRRELASWMHPRRRGDGLVVPELVGLATKAVVTAIDLGKSTAAKDLDLVHAAPMLVLVSTERDDVEAWLHTGRALQQFLLAAANCGLAAGYLNQPCQVPDLRIRLQQLAPTPGFPQLLIRVGTPADRKPATPRRPIDDVLLEAGTGT